MRIRTVTSIARIALAAAIPAGVALPAVAQTTVVQDPNAYHAGQMAGVNAGQAQADRTRARIDQRRANIQASRGHDYAASRSAQQAAIARRGAVVNQRQSNRDTAIETNDVNRDLGR